MLSGIGAGITAILGVPLVGFFVLPALRESERRWLAAGAASEFREGEITKVIARLLPTQPWPHENPRAAIYVLNQGSGKFTLYQTNCTPVGCPVQWSGPASRFFCPCHGGVLLFLFVMLFGFTGYLLPWDQKAYWATVVGTHIAGTAPLVGEYLWRILLGGVQGGTRTLGRFYAAHVLILPAMLYALILIYISMVIYQGIAPTPKRKLGAIRKEDYKTLYEESKGKGETFFEHLLRDGIVAFVLLLLLVWMAVRWKVPVEQVADPTSTNYVPRSEWYFYFLFELLWLFPGKWIPVATFYIPLASILLLLFLPFFERTPGRSPLRRPLASTFATAALLAVAYLTYQGATAPAPSNTSAALPSAMASIPPELAAGRRLFETQGCSACHVLQGAGGAFGPDLTHVGVIRNAQWIKRFIWDPNAVKPGAPMPPFKNLSEKELDALANYLASLK